MKDLVKTSAQVVASLGSFEKALEVTKDKGSLFVKRYFDSFDTDKEAERKASKFFAIYDYLRSFHCEMHKPQNTHFILNHNIDYDKFMDEKDRYLSHANPKWAQ
tara:strand:+ start:69 stop:380 length:312 start_codon:yes stop_codon:yes gene_type:complete